MSTPPATAAAHLAMPLPRSQPLWRFALVGLGPLTAMGLFAVLVAVLQRTP